MKLYYIPFVAATYAAITPENIRDVAPELLVSSARDTREIFDFIRARGGRGRFEPQITRLLIQENGQKPIFVDYEGVVRWGSSQYSLRPSSFLRLHLRLERLVAQLSKIPGRYKPAPMSFSYTILR